MNEDRLIKKSLMNFIRDILMNSQRCKPDFSGLKNKKRDRKKSERSSLY